MGSDSSGSELLQLQWNSYSTSWHAALSTLRTTGQFCDLTLVVDDGHLPAHRAVVSCCSPLMSRALSVCHHPHPAVVLRGVNMVQMRGILDFMYMGKTKVEQGSLEAFLKAAGELGVRGLSEPLEESFKQEDNLINETDIIEEAQNSKTPTKRTKSSPADASPVSKKVRKDKIDSRKTKEKKSKKDSLSQNNKNKSDLQKENVGKASLNAKEGYEATCPEIDSKADDISDKNDFAEPEIVIKKIFSPEKNGTASCNKNEKSPDQILDELNEKITVTLTPTKQKAHPENIGISVDSVGPGPSHLSLPSSPDKTTSPSDRCVMTNLPHDRAKLRDIWDTLVASEDVEGEVVYSCLCCEKTFRGKSAKSNSWSHVDHNHTPHIEHKCHMCDFISKSNDGISRHISKIHKKDQAKKDEQKMEEKEMIVLD